MLTLALDTTTKAGSVAVLDDDRVLALIHGDATRTHGERLPEEIAQAMAVASVTPREITLIAVATGPGAFTGLRIGLAAVQGLAMVLDSPVVGVSALDALASAALAAATPDVLAVAPWIDAQRGEVFAAFYPRDAQSDRLPRAAGVPLVGAPAVVLEMLPADLAAGTVFIGDGAVRYQEAIASFTGSAAQVAPPPGALAPFIARLGQQLAARGHAGPPHALQPLYVRRSDAELERARQPSRPSLPSTPSRNGHSTPSESDRSSKDDASREDL